MTEERELLLYNKLTDASAAIMVVITDLTTGEEMEDLVRRHLATHSQLCKFLNCEQPYSFEDTVEEAVKHCKTLQAM